MSQPTASSTAPTHAITDRGASGTSRRKAWGVTVMLAVFMILNFGDKAVLGLVARPAMAELGISPVQFGFIGSSFFFLFSISAVVVGISSNRVSSRWIIAVLALVWAISQFPVLFGGGATVLLVSRIVLGAGEGPALPQSLHATQNWFPTHDRSLPSNLIAIGATLGAVIAAPLLSWVVFAFGWRWAFGVLGIATLVWTVVWVLVGRDGPYQSGSDTAEPETVTPSATELLRRVPVRKILGSAMWIVAVLAGFACFWAQAVLTTWVPRYIGGVLEVGKSHVGIVFALPWLFGTLLLLGLGFLGRRIMRSGGSARWGIACLFGGALAVSGTCIMLLTVTSGAPAIAFLTIGWGSFLVFPMAPTAVAAAINPSQRAAVVSVLVGIASIGGVVSPTVVGYFVEHLAGGAGSALENGLSSAFVLTGVLLLVMGVASVILINPERTADRLQRRVRAQA